MSTSDRATQNAIFLLVWNPRDGAEKCRVRDWLRTIHLRTGGKAVVIMVASHSPTNDMPYYPNYGHDGLPDDLRSMIVGRIAIDSGTGDNIAELQRLVARSAANLPFMGEPFPASWQNVRNAVAALNPSSSTKKISHISYNHFVEICNEHGVTESSQIHTLATVFMHNVGRVIYYGDRSTSEDGVLANIMVLDAEWLSRAFVQVLEDVPTIDAGGVLDHGRLDFIWRTHGRRNWHVFPKAEHPYLIRLMHAFDISYVLKGREGLQSLVPQRLPGIEPTNLPWRIPPDLNSARLICQLENEAPGLMPRFIVQTAPYHQMDDNGCGLFWREGIFLREPTFGNESLIMIEGTEKPTMTIIVAGAQPGWFLGELYRTLSMLLSFWPGLNKIFKVGCPTRREDGRFCEGDEEFNFLVDEHLETPKQKRACRKCRRRYTPAQWLFGFGGVELVQAQSQAIRARQEYSLAKLQAPCPRVFTLAPVDRSWYDPRKFMPAMVTGQTLRLTLYSEHSLSEVISKDFTVPPTWIQWLGPLAWLGSIVLTGMAIPMTGELAVKVAEATEFMKSFGKDHGETGARSRGSPMENKSSKRVTWPSGPQLEDLSTLLERIGLAPHFGGMKFVKIRHRAYLWVSQEEAEIHAEEIPNLVYMPNEDVA